MCTYCRVLELEGRRDVVAVRAVDRYARVHLSDVHELLSVQSHVVKVGEVDILNRVI